MKPKSGVCTVEHAMSRHISILFFLHELNFHTYKKSIRPYFCSVPIIISNGSSSDLFLSFVFGGLCG